VVLFATLCGALVARSAGQRGAGQSVSGSVAGGEASRLDQARQLMGQGKALEAIKLYDAVLRDDPANAEALAYRGWLLKLAGLPDQALASLERAVAADPSYPDAHFFRGMVLYQDKHDPAGAVPELRRYLASNPGADIAPMVQRVLDQAMREAPAGT
jgi:tetratricopeptide (TPR) repeat protein